MVMVMVVMVVVVVVVAAVAAAVAAINVACLDGVKQSSFSKGFD